MHTTILRPRLKPIALMSVLGSLAFSAVVLLSTSTTLFAKPTTPVVPQKLLDAILKSEFTPLAPEYSNDASVSMDELIRERISKEEGRFGRNLRPELLHMEANYVRTAGTTGEDVLFEASFHLEPRYSSLNAAGDKVNSKELGNGYTQPVMYFIGSARTPLALPVVSNLSRTLQSDAASYTVNIGILPLPGHEGSSSDSVSYYVIIERAIQSNTSDAEVKLERFAKEFTQSVDDPVRLKLDNAPPEKQGSILKLEDGSFLDFYEDFARFFTEHIFLSSDRLKYALGKPEISPITQKLSIPYSVGAAANVKLELLSVIDPEHSKVIVDTVRRPAAYLAELSLKPFADGPYRAAIIATEIGTDKTLFTDTVGFTKSSPLIVESPTRLGGDTLRIGGKQIDYAAQVKNITFQLTEARIKTERLDQTLKDAQQTNHTLEEIVKASKRNSIAGLHVRAGFGSGPSAATNAFLGVESSTPDLAFDISFGLAYWSTIPYLSYVQPSNVSKIFSSPKSLGFQLSWIPARPFGGILEPVISMGYYGIWSTPTATTDLRSATLLVPALGLATDFGSEGTGFGASMSLGESIGLGVKQSAQMDISAKLYWRF